MSYILASTIDILLLTKLFIFVADISNMKISISFIKIDQSIDDWVDLDKYRDRICTLPQSHKLAWLLEPTGAKLRSSGVFSYSTG